MALAVSGWWASTLCAMSGVRGVLQPAPRAFAAAIAMLAAAVALLLGVGAVPAIRAADPVAPAPTLWVWDAPFSRNTTVELGFVLDHVGGGPVAERRASNDPITVDGVLANGVAVPVIGPWALAPGPDGSRTVYGQVRYESGLWSPVASIDLVLATDPASSLYIDLDPQPGLGYEISPPADGDWHTRTETPGSPAHGHASPPGSAVPTSITVDDGRWGVGFAVDEGPIVPGTYAVPEPIEEVSCGPVCAWVSRANHGDCSGSGTFTIHDVAFTPDGDLAILDADFRLACFSYLMSGSVRYGSARATVALDQDVDRLLFDTLEIGTPSAAQSVTITNIGTVPTTLGAVAIDGEAAADFAILDDACSGVTLDLGASCEVAVRFTATTRGQRRAWLTVPDSTVRGSRSVTFQGFGLQPTQLSLAAEGVPRYGPAEVAFVLTVAPPAGAPLLFVDGTQAFGPTSRRLTSPEREEFTYRVTLPPGTHVATGKLEAGDFFLESTAGPLEVTVGTRTALSLATAVDGPTASGEIAELVARLTAGAPISGGLLQVRDTASGEVLASAEASGSTTELRADVARGLGSHGFDAEFSPASPDVQAAAASFDLEVIDGPRPDTDMDTSTLITPTFSVTGSFSSTTPGATFQCRYGASDYWFACASPYAFYQNNAGTHEILVRAVLPNGLVDRTPARRQWIVDLTPPGDASVTIAGGAPYSRIVATVVSVPAVDAVAGPSHVALSNDGVAWITRPYAPTQSWTLASGTGTRWVHVKWRDVAGNWSAVASDSIALDAVVPTATTPTYRFVAGTALDGGRIAARLTWSGSDRGSGVARYQVSRRVDGGAWVTIASSLVSPSHDVLLAGGHAYEFRVRSIDRAGNVGSWVSGRAMNVAMSSERSSAIRYRGTWATVTGTSYWGGAARSSRVRGATASITTSARSIAWVSLRGPGRGRASVYVDGALVATIDLGAAGTAGRQVVWTRTWSTARARTVVIRVLGTSGRPRVELDGFAFGS